MTELAITVVSSEPDRYAAAPTILLKLRIENPAAEPVHAMVLKAQIRIEPQRRRYSTGEEERLVELFGDAPRWGETLHPFLWTHVATTVGEFTGSVEIELPVPCSYDFEVAAAKYLHSVRDGDVPIVLLFNGTIFSYRDGGLIVEPVPWHVEAEHRLPVSVWRGAMDAFFPNSGWIRLRAETIDDLMRYKSDRSLTSWEDAFELLLKEADRVSADPFEQAQRVADAVLWEGYVLYPYRASAAKNQVRWQYGVLTPKPFSEADGFERWSMQTECVLEFGLEARVDLKLRYLQVQTRTVEEFVDGEPKPVAELEVDGELWASWDEAVEHVLDVPGFDLARPGVHEVPITLEAGRETEALGAVGRVVRERYPVDAVVRIESEHCPGPYPLTMLRVSIENLTDWCETTVRRDVVMRRSLVAVHTLLHTDDTRFISLLEPPEFAKVAVESCVNEGTFPVLIGDPDQPTTVLSSPIILYDHPSVATESPGDMCDATEIDEILALRILTLTDDEKRLARSTDPRAAAIVDRIEAFTPETFASLHGEMKTVGPGFGAGPGADDLLPWWEPAVDAAVNPWEDVIDIGGVAVAKGSRVRLRPGRAGRRTDAQDLFLEGEPALVEGVFFDVDGEQHVAVLLESDPNAELQRAQGRFLYFHPDEVEPLP